MTSDATWFVGIAWSGDVAEYTGTYDDVTADVVDLPDSFIGMRKWEDRIARAGTLTLNLYDDWNNQHGEYGLYTPSNSAGPLYGLLLPMTEMIVEVTFLSVTYRLFTGYVESIDPEPQRRITQIKCVDEFEPYTRAKPRFNLWTNISSDDLLREIVNLTHTPRGAIGYWNLGVSRLGIDTVLSPADAGRDLEEGRRTFEIAGHLWRSGRTTTYQMMRDVAEAEWGRVWCDRGGNIVFKNGLFDFTDITVQGTIDTGIRGIKPVYSVKDLYNRVEVSVVPRKVGSAGSVLATLQDPARINKGESRVFRMSFRDPDGDARITAETVLSLVPGTDYVANTEEDGSGTDKTSDIDRSMTTEASSAEITITNNANQTVYITTLQVRGTPLLVYDEVTMVAEDGDSQADYTVRVLQIDQRLGEDTEAAQELADYLLDQFREPYQILEGIEIENTNDALYTLILSLTVGDLIEVVNDALGLDGLYRIISERHRARGLKHGVEWGLAPHDGATYWLLGETHYSKLGVSTVLGPGF